MASGTLFLSTFDFYLRASIIETMLLVLVPCCAFVTRPEYLREGLLMLFSSCSFIAPRSTQRSRLRLKFGYGGTFIGTS